MGYREENILLEIIEDLKPKKFLVDIGAKEVRGSNSWFLIITHHWRGSLVEPQGERCDIMKKFIKEHRLQAKANIIQDWATPHNINDLIKNPIGLLSIDVDGQDYYIWSALKVPAQIVVIEYNPVRFGIRSVMKRKNRYDWKGDTIEGRLAYGASKEALISLGRAKGYELVNFTDYNLFFVRK